MRKSRSGFTIVELLIVIVVIAILAVISAVTYQNIQRRANNSKTISAVALYVRALQIYKADQGAYPGHPSTNIASCLGSEYTNAHGSCDAGPGASNSINGTSLNTIHLAPYLRSDVPMPADTLGRLTAAGRQLGGAVYNYGSSSYGGVGGIGLYHQGGGSCPSIGGLTFRQSITYDDGSGLFCQYKLD